MRVTVRLESWTTIAFGIVFGLVAVGLLTVETVGYLKRGNWLVVAHVDDVVVPLLKAKHAEWLQAPSDWIGLHAILSPLLKIPLWLASGVVAAFLLGAGVHDLQFALVEDTIHQRGPKR